MHDWAVTESDDGSSKKIDHFRQKYQNSFWVSVWLNMKRSFIIWRRDKIFIRASIIKNVAMGLSVGFVFLDTDLSSSFFGVLFQGNLEFFSLLFSEQTIVNKYTGQVFVDAIRAIAINGLVAVFSLLFAKDIILMF